MRRLWGIWLLIVHLLLLLLLATSDFLPKAGRKLGLLPPQYVYKGPRILADKMQAFYERVDKNVPSGSVVVMGDSLIQGLCVPAIAQSNAYVAVGFGIGGDTLEGITVRLRRLEAKEFASAIVIQGGINDLLMGASNDEFKRRYSLMLDAIPEGKPFVSVLMFPLDECKWGISNTRIEDLNKWISNMIDKKDHGAVCDLCQYLSEPLTVGIREEYHIGDGLHLNKAGNEVFLRELRRTIDAILAIGN